jgi:hypothetical protein
MRMSRKMRPARYRSAETPALGFAVNSETGYRLSNLSSEVLCIDGAYSSKKVRVLCAVCIVGVTNEFMSSSHHPIMVGIMAKWPRSIS